MAIEYIEDTYLKEAMEVLSDVLFQESGPRIKNVIMTVRGSGGGKTRMLEEIRRKVNERYDGVAIAVTFNNLTDYNSIKERFIINHHHHHDCGAFNLILSIICRLCCIIYGYSFEESVLRMKNLQFLDSLDMNCDILQLFIQHIINQITKNGTKLKDFILMIDEVARIDDGSGSLNSALSIITKAMLNTPFKSFDGNPIRTALILSSLVITPYGTSTDSSRKIRTLQLPPELNVDDVLNKWWLPLLSSKDKTKLKVASLSDWDKFKLRLLANTINTLPRALEEAGTNIMNRLQCKDAIDDELISSVFDSIKKMLQYYATGVTGDMSPVLFGHSTPKYLYHLIYMGNRIKLDPSIMQLLRFSVYSNSLKTIGASESIFPKGSILMIIALAECANEEVVGNLLLPSSCFMNTYRSMQNVLKKSKDHQDGDALESVGINWLQTRLAVAKSYGKTSIKLSELFAINIEIDSEIFLPAHSSYWNDDDEMMLPPLYKDNEDFMTKFDTIEETRDLMMLKSCPDQQWDSMIITSIIDPIDGKKTSPFVIFIEFKSWQTKASIPSTRQQNLDQYDVVMKLHKFLNSKDCTTRCYDSSQSLALKDGQFIYIYLTTYPKIKKRTTQPNLYITDEAEAKQFFGMLFPFYQTVRSSIDSQQI
jgi:hypothetical protein